MKKVIIFLMVLMIFAYLAPLGLVLYHRNSKINSRVDYVIVLGAKVNGNYPSATLKYRLDETMEYYNQNKDVKVVVTGGQGVDEQFPEADVMKNYLINQGMVDENIIIENKSINTFENMQNTKNILKDKINSETKIGVVTTDFHIYRSSMICHRIFKQKCQMQSSMNYNGIAGIQSLVREPFAVYKTFIYDR